MPNPEKPLPPRDDDASASDDDAPVSSERPSGSSDAVPDSNANDAAKRATGPARPADDRPRVSRDVLLAYLGSKEAQAHIVAVVRRGLHKRTPQWIVDEIVSNVNDQACTTEARPRSESTMRGWLTSVAVSRRNKYFRTGAANEKWVNRDAEIEDQAPDPSDAPDENPDDAAPTWLIGPWLEARVANFAADREAYEIIVERGRHNKSYAQIAAERGESVNAVTKKVQRLKAKYTPLRRRHNERRHTLMLLLKLFGGVAVAAIVVAAAFLLYRRMQPAPAPRPAPSASVAPVETAPPSGGLDVGHPAPE